MYKPTVQTIFTEALDTLAEQVKTDRSILAAIRLTKKSNTDVQALAFFHLE